MCEVRKMQNTKNVGSRNAYDDYIRKQQLKAAQLLERQQKINSTGGDVRKESQNNKRNSNKNDIDLSIKKQDNHSKKDGEKEKSCKKRKTKRIKGMTYAQKKRASYNYRSEYFKRNPGIYGSIWFCSQCGKMLIGKHNVVIDHIVPLNSVAGVNRTFNTVAICQSCNSKKSDIIDYRIVKGYLAKIFEVFTSHLPDTLALILSFIVSLFYRIFNLIFSIFSMLLNFVGKRNVVIIITIATIFLFFYFNI